MGHLNGTPDEIIEAICLSYPGVLDALARARINVPYIKREIWQYQAAALYALAHEYGSKWSGGTRFLEIGTAWGYSAAVMAEAAPETTITTLNPKLAEYERAVVHLAAYRNVIPLMEASWDYTARDSGPFNFIFVDGSHDQVERDFVWWDCVKPGGLMLFHDYSPDGSGRPCREVYDALNGWLMELGRSEFDMLIVDDTGIGMAGLIKD